MRYSVCRTRGRELPQPGHLEGHSLVRLMVEPECEWKAAAFSQYPRRKVGTGADLDGRPPGREDRGVMSYTIQTGDYRYRYTEWLRRATGEVKARDSTTIASTPNLAVAK